MDSLRLPLLAAALLSLHCVGAIEPALEGPSAGTGPSAAPGAGGSRPPPGGAPAAPAPAPPGADRPTPGAGAPPPAVAGPPPAVAGPPPAGASVPPGPRALSLGPAPARRLTRDEYLNGLTDVLGIDPAATARLLPDDAPSAHSGLRNSADALATSAERAAAYEAAAIQVAAAVDWPRRLAGFAGCQDATAPCRQGFVRQLGRRLYRRPLTDAEVQNLARLFTGDAGAGPLSFEAGARLVLEAMLQSPHFLYVLERGGERDPTLHRARVRPHDLATRLALFLWRSLPDEALLAAADAGKLGGEADIAQQVDRLLADARARRGLRTYAEDWLQLYRLESRAPDPARGVTAELLRDMKEETLRFVTRLALEAPGDLTQLFTDRKTELSPALAKVYGVSGPPTGFRAHDTSGDAKRVGILTQPAVLAVHGGIEHASIVDRGLVVLRTFLCQDVPTPPDSVLTQFKMVPPNLTDRDRFAIHGESPTCAACHLKIDPLGHPFEPYDVMGRHRARDEHGNPLRDDGVAHLDGADRAYANVQEFAALVAGSEEARRCLTRKLLQAAFGRSLTAGDEPLLDEVDGAFTAGGRTFRAAALAVARTPDFRIVDTD